MSYAYTRLVTIGGVSFTEVAEKISFTWTLYGGCNTASIFIPGATFNEDYGIALEDVVIISRTTGLPYWKGIVSEIRTEFPSGLTISCIGLKAKLSEVIPTGIFGTDVTVAAPTELTLTEAAADSGAPGLTSGNVITVLVTAIDEEGETFSGSKASAQTGGTLTGTPTGHTYTSVAYATATVSAADKKITVSWTASANAKGYRVYANLNSGTITTDDLLGANGLERFDVTGTSFVLDGSVTGTTADFPIDDASSATTLTPTIANTDIEDVVNHFLDAYLPSGLSKGTVEIGTLDEPVDFLDYRENSADLGKVLDALVAHAGAVHWYVDETGAVHFRSLGTTDLELRANVTGTVLVAQTDILMSATKTVSRDSVTHLKIEGEADFEEGYNNSRLGATWDRTTVSSLSSQYIVGLTKDPRVITTTVDPSSANSPAFPSTANRAFVQDYGDGSLQDWLDAYPNFRWLKLMADNNLVTDATFTRIFANFLENLNMSSGATRIPARSRVVVKRFPGLVTSKSAGQAGYEWLTRRKPNPTVWQIQVEEISQLVRPGRMEVDIYMDTGASFTDLTIRSITYNFDENISASMELGDEVYSYEEETEDQRAAIAAHSVRRTNSTRWTT